MRISYRFFICILLCLTVSAMTGPAMAQVGARARFVNVMPGSPPLDIFVNSQLAAADLSYGEASPYINVPVGNLDIVANRAGSTALLFGQRTNLANGSAVTFVAAPAADSQMQAFAENLSPLEFGNGRLSIVYAIADGPAVDIVLQATEQRLAEEVVPGAVVGDYVLSADVFDLAVLASDGDGSASLLDFKVHVAAATSQMAIVFGDVNGPQVITTRAATAGAAGSGMVRFVHAVQGATPVDLSINETLIVHALAYADPTEHIALPGGSHRIALGIGGVEITSLPLSIAAGQAQTVIVMGSPANLNVSSHNDELGNVNPSSATVSLINAIPGSVVDRLSLSSGVTAATNVEYGQNSSAAQIVTGSQQLAMGLTIGDESGAVNLPATNFYGGSYYNLIALPGDAFSSPQLVIAETSILRGADIEAMMMDSAPAAETESEPLTTTVETDAPVAAVSAADIDGPTALVNVNLGANLQLREYPASASRSLGLAPSGSLLYVLGRRGLTEYYGAEPEDLPVDLSDFDADPAAGLERWQDLLPADTWLYVTYMTPDGGSVNAWVNALYLNVQDEDGEPQRLANLEMVRQNEWGRTFNTSILPPTRPVRVGAQVYNLNQGVGLNVRMANNDNSEILGQVEAGTIVGLTGLDEADEWAYIVHQPSVGVTLSGWVSARFLLLLFDGVPIDLVTLREKDPSQLGLISSETRGSVEVTGDAEPPLVPTRDPFLGRVAGTVQLNPDANLHLRIRPNSSTESLALIPSGAKMVVDGITESGGWYRVTFAGTSGWVFSPYVSLDFNSKIIPNDELQARLTRYDDLGDALPEPEPEGA